MKNLIYVIVGVLFLPLSVAAQSKTSYRFDFGNGGTKKGYQQVRADMVYSKERGYGFLSSPSVTSVERSGKDPLISDFITGNQPFYFTVDVQEGNFDIKVTFGDLEGISTQTVRAECRRLMVGKLQTEKGEIVSREFTVHVRNSLLKDSESGVKLKPREVGYLHWDNQLTLEFNGEAPKVCAIEITKTNSAVTLFLAGNSTVVDQANEPYAAWGQMVPIFFQPKKVAVANYAESGETLKAFERENRLKKILSLMKKGDYLFIEFAHNDQKPGGNYLDPFTTYKEMLKHYISETRKREGLPVLVTSMHRRKFGEEGKIVNTLGDYPEAVRQTGLEENVPVIDLNRMSKTLYEAWGEEQSIKAFVHYPAGTFPGQEEELKDNTHFSPYGAFQLAKCVVEGIKNNNLDISDFMMEDLSVFDHAHPDSIESFYWPLSPSVSSVKPDGN